MLCFSGTDRSSNEGECLSRRGSDADWKESFFDTSICGEEKNDSDNGCDNFPSKLILSSISLIDGVIMQASYEFEWDEVKSEINMHKHGISFCDVLALWDDPFFLEVHLTSDPEDRWAVIGKVSKTTYITAIITYRSEKIRIISARKSTKKEIDIYDKY